MQISFHINEEKQVLHCLETSALYYPLKLKMEKGISMYLICSSSLITVNEESAENQNIDTILIPPCCNQNKALPLLSMV